MITNYEMKILVALHNRYQAAGCKPFDITMKSTGITMTLSPTRDGFDAPDSFFRADYVIVTGTDSSICFGGTPEDLAKQLANYDNIHREWQHDKERLRQHRDALAKKAEDPDRDQAAYDNAYSFYSDWHKEIFGFRPCGLQYGPNSPAAA